jgi:hypothetical protein
MSGYLDLIFIGPQQALPIIVGAILWTCLAGLGALVSGKDRLVDVNVISGWAIISGLFTILGVFIEQPFLYLSIFAGLAALFGIYRTLKTGQELFVPGIWRIFILALPLLWIAGAMEPSQWDEFSHWLPAPKYLFEFNGFPTKELPFSGPHMLPAYPYGWPFLTYLSAVIAGNFIDNVTSTLNLFLLLSFSTFALRTGYRIVGKELGSAISWPFATAVVLFATLFNPTFVQKIVLTAYSDVSTSVITGFSLLIGYYFLENLAGRRSDSVLNGAWQLALALSLLVNVRQANLVLVVVIFFAIIILAARDDKVSFSSFLKYSIMVVAPTLLVYSLWRFYVVNEFGQNSIYEVSFRPFATWNFAEIPTIIKQISYVAFKKIGFFGPMLIACFFAIRGLIKCKTPFDRLSILIACTFVGYTSFLFLTYLGHFQPKAAVTVVSFWRYSTHNGMVAVAFIVIGSLVAFRPHFDAVKIAPWFKGVSLALVVILPFAFAYKLRFDLEPPKPHFTKVAKDMASFVPKGSRVFVLDPNGTGESNKITFYHMNIYGDGYLAAFHDNSTKQIKIALHKLLRETYVLVHSKTPDLEKIFKASLNSRTSYLFQKKENSWKLLREWQKPTNHIW